MRPTMPNPGNTNPLRPRPNPFTACDHEQHDTSPDGYCPRCKHTCDNPGGTSQ